MFVSFCLIAKYPLVLNKLSLNCGIGPGSPFGAKPFPNQWWPDITYANMPQQQQQQQQQQNHVKQMTSIYIFTQISVIFRGHTF